jgi:hypothetical protein
MPAFAESKPSSHNDLDQEKTKAVFLDLYVYARAVLMQPAKSALFF